MKRRVSVVGLAALASIAMGIGACSTNEIISDVETQPWDAVLEESITGYQDEMECVTPVHLWSPAMCMEPPASGPRMSQANSGGHARKLYHLYVSDSTAYTHAASGEIENPVGLTLVKEAHEAILVEDQFWQGDSFHTMLSHDARVGGETMYMPGAIRSLFIMSKVGDVDTPGTDRGWVYGGATPDGTVYASGLIQSCMNCHKKAPHDRLFGLKDATTINFQN